MLRCPIPKIILIVTLSLLACLVVSCTWQGEEVSLGDPLEAPPQAPDSLTVDGEDENTGEVPAAGQPQLPPGIAPVARELFPPDWTLATPIQTCPDQELTLYGVSYLENGLMMVSFEDPFLDSDSPQGSGSVDFPLFMESYAKDGTLQAAYQCTKHPDAPNLVYCFGEPLPAGIVTTATLACGPRALVNLYDPTGILDPGEGDSGEQILNQSSDLDGSLLFPQYFGYNSAYLAGIWGTQGTSLDPALDFITASQAAAELGFSGEIKTLVGLFNVLSACQIAADLGSPLPEGCQLLGSAYYQPQTDCQSFPACYQACAEDLGYASPGGEPSLGKKELLDYLDEQGQSAAPASCTDYQYWGRSVLFTGASGEDGDGDGSDYLDDLLSPQSVGCLFDPDNPFCSGEFGGDGEDQEVTAIPVDIGLPLAMVGCVLDPDNPFCSAEFPTSDAAEEGRAISLCAAAIAWHDWSGTYGDASALLAYLLSAGPSVAQEKLPASCQQTLDQTGAAFDTGLGGLLSSLLYSGTISSCTYQASFVVPAEQQAGGSGGGQSSGGPTRPDCGPGLIAVEWKGSWICIPQN